jgi:hypothetical protein
MHAELDNLNHTPIAREQIYLFLDFDGVLHPLFPRADFTDAENQHFAFVPRLEQLLRAHPHVLVVISSTWRVRRDLDTLREPFSPDIRRRIVGKTPVLVDRSDGRERGHRQKEVERWLAEYAAPGAPWVALDDDDRLYREDAPLVVAHDRVGPRETRLLCMALADPIGYAKRIAQETKDV